RPTPASPTAPLAQNKAISPGFCRAPLPAVAQRCYARPQVDASALASRRAPAVRRAGFPTMRGSMSSAIFDVLRRVTTATITTMRLKRGTRRCWMHGPKPLVPGGARLIGPAFTLRFVPAREDLATPESWGKPISTRAAIEAMPEGVIGGADPMGGETAG